MKSVIFYLTLSCALFLVGCGSGNTGSTSPERVESSPTPIVVTEPTESAPTEAPADPTATAASNSNLEGNQATATPAKSVPTATSPAKSISADILQASFKDAGNGYEGKGTAFIKQFEDGSYELRFEDDFSVGAGPDLYVVLSTTASPTQGNQLNERDLEVALLQSFSGEQSYKISKNVGATLYRSVVIYCKAFNVIFATADLQAIAE